MEIEKAAPESGPEKIMQSGFGLPWLNNTS